MIEFESVGKTFRDGTAAVVDLTLTAPSDKITVIVGPSGCGKTTTLRMVNRMIEPTKGRILWDGTPLRSLRKTTLRRQMGYVIQSGGLFPHRTVLDNIGTVPSLLGWSKSKIEKRSAELLDNVGLDRKLADRYPAQLSGGQQQRVGVARALAADPLVMLMDEPFSAVDPVVRSELHEFFLNLQRQISKTIILITHDIDEAIKLGDQVAILRVGGRLAQVGTPQELLEEPADAFVEGFVGRDRGYRSLSFLPASGLSLGGVKVVREVGSAAAGEPTLIVDQDARPIGWLDLAKSEQVLPLGATFDVETGTLRNALDSALTSPFGLAVGVTTNGGRYAGVVAAEAILAQATRSRTEPPESISVAEPADDHASMTDSSGGAHALATDEGAPGPGETSHYDPGPDDGGYETGQSVAEHGVAGAAELTDETAQHPRVSQQVVQEDAVHRESAHDETGEHEAAGDAGGQERYAELGDESGRDVAAEALVPGEGEPQDLLNHESQLSASESRQAAPEELDEAELRR